MRKTQNLKVRCQNISYCFLRNTKQKFMIYQLPKPSYAFLDLSTFLGPLAKERRTMPLPKRVQIDEIMCELTILVLFLYL